MLPFTLTGAQQQAVADIAADMSKPQRMLRLLQGDVGSGKTMVALIAMMQAVDNGAQAVLMAPTEILALQHAETIGPYLDELGIAWDVVIGRNQENAAVMRWLDWPTAPPASPLARMRCSSRISNFRIWAWRWLMSNTASACSKGWPCRTRAKALMCW